MASLMQLVSYSPVDPSLTQCPKYEYQERPRYQQIGLCRPIPSLSTERRPVRLRWEPFAPESLVWFA